ncbi:protein SUPPRESSOR OF MAX2 1-like [Olea europaea var. sylvestris]|uniref:SUPPRESSOR OF MAX2 1-like n=1 Tax=Olea europaea subsp. europaea TaxID=158383 RepID=A0A8S0RLH6_OLEEU|nr:protein SUPPRESSOR OF MAX2 1-like [Olea europaea var. sylvestris]CAA2980106.1 SUPPRESSOR OF MAX2 1-like [Olea europaea subsp. europaea]
MRTGLSTIQQTLTPEAASVLNHSIAEAGRRNHGQTTPLHVAATLLAAPSGFLRQACIRSHPNSSHPLQCRALELCFSVALERLPTDQNMAPGMEPGISNALMAALKRAHAHQRRGCPEQQQQPLLAVKVELEQLIISILDDPSVSRVMREASFSSPAVKAAIEQLQTSNSNANAHNYHVAGANVNLGGAFGGIAPRMLSIPGQLSALSMPKPSASVSLSNRNMYLNPRLQQGGDTRQIVNQRNEEVKKVIDILVRTKKRNPVLVGDSEPEAVVKELLKKLENKELGIEGPLSNVQVISIEKYFLSDKNQIPMKIKELGGVIECRIKSGGIILDLRDLKWLVEQPMGFGGVQQQRVVSEMERAAVVEMAKLLARFGGEGNNGDHKLWLIGTATYETYKRCQVFYTTMENDWDLQAVPIALRSSLPGMFPRLGTERILSTPTESLISLKSVPIRQPIWTQRVSENLDTAQRTTFCPRCSENYEKEVAKLVAIEKSFSKAKPEVTQQSLPQWLQNAKLDSWDAITMDDTQGKDEGMLSKQKSQELQKKWGDTCLNLHPDFHRNICSKRTAPAATLSMTSLKNPSLLAPQPFQPKLQTSKPLGESLQLNINQVTSCPAGSPPRSPVGTDLSLGRKGTESTPKKAIEDYVKDSIGYISSEPQTEFLDKFASALDSDLYKKLLKGLLAMAWWQAEAASAVASAMTRCRLGNGKRRGAGSRGDIWLLFTGPDRVAKKKMASVLAEQICGINPVLTCLSSRRDDEDSNVNLRGKTIIDRIAEAVRRNPFSVIMLEDIDKADMMVRGSVKQAMDRGRLTDTHGRDVSLGNAIVILTGDWSITNHKDGHFVDEKKLASVASGNCQLELVVKEKCAKRQGNWLSDEDRPTKPRIEVGSDLSLDLNLAADNEDETNTSHNSSVLSIDHEDVLDLENTHFSITSVPHELVSNVDDFIPFKPVDLAFVLHEIKKTISVKFSMVVDENMPIKVEDDVIEKILRGLWHDRISLQEWIEKVLVPGFEQLKMYLPSVGGGSKVVWLVINSESDGRGNGDWLPGRITVKG